MCSSDLGLCFVDAFLMLFFRYAVGYNAGTGADEHFSVFLKRKPDCDAGVHISGEIQIADRTAVNAALVVFQLVDDLGRNDLGKICDFGTVEVEKYMSIERYSHVMHIGSTVKGQLRKDKTAVDAIDSVLPAGTLSGAPKLRACQIINILCSARSFSSARSSFSSRWSSS